MWQETDPRDLDRRKLAAETETARSAWVLLALGVPLVVLAAWWTSGPRTVPFAGLTVGGLHQDDVEVLEVAVRPGDRVAAGDDVLLVELAKGRRATADTRHAGLVTAVHTAPGRRIRVGEPLLTLRDPYRRDTFAPRLAMTAAVGVLLFPLAVPVLIGLARLLNFRLSPSLRLVLLRTAAYTLWSVGLAAVFWFEHVPILLAGELADVGFLVTAAALLLMIVARVWIFSLLFRQDEPETLVAVALLACVEYGLWRLVDWASIMLAGRI